MATFSYRALAFKQGDGAPMTVLFAAAAKDIDRWSGIPEKKSFDGADRDSTGFQRVFNEKREQDLITFFSQAKNTLQNPLLCATLRQAEGNVIFSPDNEQQSDGVVTTGTLVVNDDYLEGATMEQLFELLRDRLESRVPHVKGRKPTESAIARVRELMRRDDEEVETTAFEEDEEEGDASDAIANSELTPSSHVEGFWEEVAARHEVLKELNEGGQSYHQDTFAGYTRDALLSYVRPIVLVDGQHRLRGAVKQAEQAVASPEAMTELSKLVATMSADDAETEIYRRFGRSLPVSLLMDDDPAEHVFQFVVVNQKATPIGKALLGTIVSTTLSDEELQGVSDRLEAAAIRLDDSRAVSMSVLDRGSPFYGFVNRGLKGEQKDCLDWSVMVSLVNLFRNLKGARVWGSELDYAALWKKKYLQECAIAIESGNPERSPIDVWRQLDGPWRHVFIKFWQRVRQKFSSDDRESLNAWGSTAKSQLFNKVSLNVLASDFFSFLHEKSLTFSSMHDLDGIVDQWLAGVADDYFSRPWGGTTQGLRGVKKDSTGIRNQWSKLWRDYRQDPSRRPNVADFRKPLA
ncbi:hypothetical protein [Paraburkholderia bryophila]|uniref:DGQHR domain-containing protein n=1 Tax=Paraburkholderia bryophila TaxID=420952 RepID=A0A7Z0B1L6_9BURK|nr:hypothetical protein [Paraburkholderia bryophila]NYH17824.1 hypothetical protein [Paraburkholderia bryophila]